MDAKDAKIQALVNQLNAASNRCLDLETQVIVLQGQLAAKDEETKGNGSKKTQTAKADK